MQCCNVFMCTNLIFSFSFSFHFTYFDVRITYPNAPSNRSKNLTQLYETQEKEKKRKYEERVIEVEKGSFCPLIFSTSGGMGPMCTKHHKRVAQMISLKRNESYADIMRFIRTKLRFVLLKSVLMCLRGIRGKQSRTKGMPISSISFGLIPEEEFYEA